MKTEKITLYFKQGSSDKIYKASLEEIEKTEKPEKTAEADDDTFVVNFAYGRRGDTLKTGTKTKKPVAYASAKKIYDKLVKSKTVKGYTPGEEGSLYVHTDDDARYTGVHCQLLTFVAEPEVTRLITDDDWWAQEKHDGKRMLLHKTETITAINRSGLSIGAPEPILTSAGQVDQTYLVDGEAVGETLLAFDILEINQTDIKSIPYSKRLAHLETLGLQGAIRVVETAKSEAEKGHLYDRLKASGAEGIVFKQHSAPYTAGRPNSGGAQVKFKFYATASVIVTKINDKRSVAVAVSAGEDQENREDRIEVGNVTIPPNKEIPALNSVVEVRYLYAYKGGSLYQPTYLQARDDVGLADCLMSQLKYKQDL